MITNRSELAANNLRRQALNILNAGYQGININNLVSKHVSRSGATLRILDKTYDLKKYHRVFLIGFGKGSADFSLGVASALGPYLTAGAALDINQPHLPLWQATPPEMEFLLGTHPLPSLKNVAATNRLLELVRRADKYDLVLFLITGGGSSLLCGSAEEMSESVLVTKKMTALGADIIELNTVRKHLSSVKGGQLASLAYPAEVVSLIACDICCDIGAGDLSFVASGPTILDQTTKAEAVSILNKYGFNSSNFNLRATPKDKHIFSNTTNLLFAYNEDALSAMLQEARTEGFNAYLSDKRVTGEASNVFLPYLNKLKPGEAVILGGETTVTIHGNGRGGRNQEAVLGALVKSSVRHWSSESWLVASIASDAYDNTPVAGALGDTLTLHKAELANLHPDDFLHRNDSFSLFSTIHDHILATPDSFNVADLLLLLRV